MLSEKERSRIVSALRVWARSDPDLPVAGFLGGRDKLTRHQLAEAVAFGKPDGEAFLEYIEHGVRREGIEKVTERFMRRARAS